MIPPRKRAPAQEVLTLALPPVSLASGERLAERYTMDQLYGAGPLGHTYRARDPNNRIVAVKVLAHELCPTPNERLNVITEVSKLIGHDMANVAVPVDAGTDRGAAFVVTPWVRGRSLRRVLGAYRDAGRAMPHEEVYGVIEGVVHAVRQLHTVAPHGALYPESVQIGVDGKVKLTDASLVSGMSRARLIEYFDLFPDVLPYFAPEVRAGKASSAGSDLYALGALTSELLTGDPAAAAAGIVGPMLHGLPPEIAEALCGLVATKAARRAAALPALLGGLARAVRSKAVPVSTTLPPARARTDVMPSADRVAVPKRARGRRDG